MTRALSPSELERNVSTNVRRLRETRGISQEDLAQRMADRGHAFSQATIWKIEQGKRPLKMTEAIALAEELGLSRWGDLAMEPTWLEREGLLREWHHTAHEKYGALMKATVEYLDAQVQIAFGAAEIRDAGHPVNKIWTHWLTVPAERAVIEARISEEKYDQIRGDLDAEVDTVIRTLEERGYSPTIDYTDIRSSDAEDNEAPPTPREAS